MKKIPVKNSIFKISFHMLTASRSVISLSAAMLFIILSYRLRLLSSLSFEEIKPFDFKLKGHVADFISVCLKNDLTFFIIALLFVLIFYIVYMLEKNDSYRHYIKLTALVLIYPSILLMALIFIAHYKLLFAVQTGLNYMVVQEALTNVSFGETFKFLEPMDYILLFLPVLIFLLLFKFLPVVKRWLNRVLYSILLCMFFMSVFLGISKNYAIADEIRVNPALFFLSDVMFSEDFSEEILKSRISDENMTGMHFSSREYVNDTNPVKLIPGSSKEWNVVFIILESVGTRYIFDETACGEIPMPFLKKLSEKGWFLKNNYTSSNISSRAVFSLLSGLHDFFKEDTFGIKNDAVVPTIYNFLGKEYDGFLVSPASLSWYFPLGMIKNSGLPEIHSFETLKFKIKEEEHPLGHYITRDELSTADFFAKRISRAKEPFFALYISYIAHFPYFDYGKDYQICKDISTHINRYYNNLRLLDHVVEQIYKQIQDQGLLERTIFVITGDHGQAFGQHKPNNFLHFRYSYKENLQAPVIIYQPALFIPRVVDTPTCHIDIMPTLLDAMRIPYDPGLLQGESLFQNKLKRKYLFFYGFEKSITSLSTEGIKMHYSLKDKHCWVFDLNTDPDENKSLSCDPYKEQLDAMLNIPGFQNDMLVKYNTALKEHRDLNGHSHHF